MKIGLELELPDIKTDVPIPPELGVYDYEDFTIVNSCGIANDPLKRDILIGSEINMTPVSTCSDMLKNVERLYDILQPGPTNFKCNLHVHISIPGLEYDFVKLKKLCTYTFYYASEVYKFIDPLPEIPNDPLYRERHCNLLHSHQYQFPLHRKKYILESTTWEDIRDRQQPMKEGIRMTHLIRRCGINIRSLWDNGTVEFRHFFGTDNLSEYELAIEWCILYLVNAIGDQKPLSQLLDSRLWNVPKPPRWDPQLYQGWKDTNLKLNSRKAVRKKLYTLVTEGIIPESAVSKKVLKDKH